jgi:hypothetical protein
MAHATRQRVRATDNPFVGRTPKVEFFRKVDAPLLRRKTLSRSSVTV